MHCFWVFSDCFLVQSSVFLFCFLDALASLDFKFWLNVLSYPYFFRPSIDNRGGAKNAYVRIRSWHKSMSRSHVKISCQDLMSRSDVHFSVGFPVFPVKYFSIFGNLYLSLPFSVRFPVFAAKHFSKLEFCIYQCFSGLDFLIQS